MKLISIVIFSLFLFRFALAAPESLALSGQILKSDGSAFEYSSVSFVIEIVDPAGSCTLFKEQVNGYNMIGSKGYFDLGVGAGTRSFPDPGVFPSFVISQVFESGTSLSCMAGGSYTAPNNAARKLRVSFYDGSSWQLISPDKVIHSTGFAFSAKSASSVQGKTISDLMLKNQFPGSACSGGQVASWDGSQILCVTPATGVLDVLAGTGLSVSGSTTKTLSANFGTTAGTIMQGNDSRVVSALQIGTSFAGDVSGVYSATKVEKIQTVPVSATLPTSGQVLSYNGSMWAPQSIAAGGVTSVGMAVPAYMTVSGAPITTSGTITLGFSSAAGNKVFASPIGAAGLPSFRSLNIGDIKSTVGGLDFLNTAPACSAGTALSYISATDRIECVSVSLWSVSGSDVFRSSGNVGIGTSTPSTPLHVSSTSSTVGKLQSTSPVSILEITNNTGTTQLYTGASNSFVMRSDSGKFWYFEDADGSFTTNRFKMTTAAADGLFLKSDASGAASWSTVPGTILNPGAASNFAIGATGYALNGTSANNTLYGLDAGKSLNSATNNTAIGKAALFNTTTGSYNVAIGLESLPNLTSGTFNTSLGHQNAANVDTGTQNLFLGARAGFYAAGASSRNVFIGYNSGPASNTVLNDQLWIANSTGTPLIFGDFAGKKVGIGTISPTAVLDIQYPDLTSAISITNTSSSASQIPTLAINQYNNSDVNASPRIILKRSRGTMASRSAVQNGDMLGKIQVFGQYDSSASDRFASAIEFVATANFSASASNTAINFVTDSGGTSSVKMSIRDNGNIGVGTVSPSYKFDVQGGDINTSGSVRAAGVALSSDVRFKKNVMTIENSLNKILSLRGVEYDWRKEEFPSRGFTDHHQIGVIAQEVEKVFPELILEDHQGYKSVNYPALVAPLVESVKELNAKKVNQIEFEKLRAENEMMKKWICSKDPDAGFCQ